MVTHKIPFFSAPAAVFAQKVMSIVINNRGSRSFSNSSGFCSQPVSNFTKI